MKENLLKNAAKALNLVRLNKPLAPSLTNSVTINFVANAQLAIGGAAAMFYKGDEYEKAAAISGAFYVNLGTIFDFYKDTLPRLLQSAKQHKIPVVLDPVGVGFGELRSELLREFAKIKPSIIRANASEILALCEFFGVESGVKSAGAKGVESVDSVMSAKNAALNLAKFINGVVAMSGEFDIISDGKSVIKLAGGSKYMPLITGSGCSLGGVIACFAGLSDGLNAALAGSLSYKIAGEIAEKRARGTASFQVEFLDALSNLNENDILKGKIEILDN